MPKARCPGCGRLYFGWSLRYKKGQKCSHCSTDLILNSDDAHPIMIDDNNRVIFEDTQWSSLSELNRN